MRLMQLGAGEPRLVELYTQLYLPAFAAQREPLESWQRALAGDAGYAMNVLVAVEDVDDALVGAITYELYPHSRCGFMTYLVVAPDARTRGLGRRLFDTAAADLYARGARAVFGEVNDPRVHGDAARPRLARFERWGARVMEVAYVQPSLGAGLTRDRGLCLIVVPPVPSLTGETVRAFVAELFAVTEGGPPDRELEHLLAGISEEVSLRAPL